MKKDSSISPYGVPCQEGIYCVSFQALAIDPSFSYLPVPGVYFEFGVVDPAFI